MDALDGIEAKVLLVGMFKACRASNESESSEAYNRCNGILKISHLFTKDVLSI